MKRSAVPLREIVAALDEELNLAAFPRDPSNNGLQIEGASGGVSKIACGVDASPDFYEKALASGAQLLLVHHGISWGSSLARIAGPNYRLVAPLIKADAALYAAHLPLDAHLSLGNNAGLAKAIGLEEFSAFGTYAGYAIGVRGSFDRPVAWSEVLRRLKAACPDGHFQSLDFGKAEVRHVGIVSGGGADEFSQAVDAGLDAFITGELGLADYNAIKNNPINFAAAGHYATERFGVKALGSWLAEKFGLECEFVDLHLPW